jgi:hypothetical protein
MFKEDFTDEEKKEIALLIKPNNLMLIEKELFRRFPKKKIYPFP